MWRTLKSCDFENNHALLFSPEELTLIERLRISGLTTKADEIVTAAEESFRKTRAHALDELLSQALGLLGESLLLGRAYGVRRTELDNARSAIGDVRRTLGDSTTRNYLNETPDPLDPHHVRRQGTLLEGLLLEPIFGQSSDPFQ
jgi:hypothetical protein